MGVERGSTRGEGEKPSDFLLSGGLRSMRWCWFDGVVDILGIIVASITITDVAVVLRI